MMRLSRLSLVVPVLLALGGCGHKAAQTAPPETAAISDNAFLAMALARTGNELDLSQLAAKKASDPTVKRYAAQITQHRSGLHEQLATLAQAGGVNENPNVLSRHDELQGLSGDDFDRGYLAAEIQNQQNDIDAFRNEATAGWNIELKKLAAAQIDGMEKDRADAISTVTNLPLPPPPQTQTNYPGGMVPGLAPTAPNGAPGLPRRQPPL